ncbi:uncharacterized protein LOC123551680 [Mercenaria mercenaria]|uniref:uncharacterized protein LOC123551680 n=1 Tax=Mercenaria mercenaria TaxID=6596 RepID=UPI00234F92FE|nr:uncharacterized protein LOC123551680 [Mercenaria mercenaria]
MSDNPEKCAYYLRIVRFTVDAGTEAVRELLYYYKAKRNLAAFFAGRTISDELKLLKRKHVLSNEQYQRVIASSDADDFDLSLLLTLLTNIFACMIETPVNGWSKPVDEHDTSTGADLLRLKDLRNLIIGHKTNARLSSEEFEKLWGQLENILTRILKLVDGGSEDKIRERLGEYKTKALEPSGETEQKYLDLIQHWYDEFTTQQNEVEKLCDRTEEFCLLFKNKIPERYSRYVLLLCEGGLLVLTSTLHRKLQEQKTDLKTLLKKNRAVLRRTGKNVQPLIFRKTGEINTDVSSWGLSLFAEILLSIFHSDLTLLESRAIHAIKEASENYARSALASLDSDKFRTYWTDIISNITILSAQQDERTQMECQKLIKKHDKEPINEDAVKLYLSQLLQDCRPLNSLIALYKETRNKLKIAVETLQKEGVDFGKEKALDLKMMTVGKAEEKKELAEDILYTVWQKAVNMSDGSDDFPTIKEAVNKILERIKTIPDVTIANVEKHCIILTLHCATTTGFLSLHDYLKCESFFETFECISAYFSDLYGENITVTAFVTLESMQNALDTLYEEDTGDDDLCTRLQLRCTSVNAMKNVQRMLEDDETANAVNQLAQAISEHVDENISVESSLEMGGLGEVFANPLQCLSRSQWQPYLLPRIGTSLRTLIASPHLAYLQRLVDDIQHPDLKTYSRYREPIIMASSSSEDEDESVHPHVSVHRSRSLDTERFLSELHPLEISDDARDNIRLIQNQRTSFENSPSESRMDSPNYIQETQGDSFSVFNWDDLNIRRNPNKDSSRSSSVCSFA